LTPSPASSAPAIFSPQQIPDSFSLISPTPSLTPVRTCDFRGFYPEVAYNYNRYDVTPSVDECPQLCLADAQCQWIYIDENFICLVYYSQFIRADATIEYPISRMFGRSCFLPINASSPPDPKMNSAREVNPATEINPTLTSLPLRSRQRPLQLHPLVVLAARLSFSTTSLHMDLTILILPGVLRSVSATPIVSTFSLFRALAT
jgi:hypothetical protein